MTFPLPISTQLTPGGPALLKGAGFGQQFFVNSNGTGSATSGGLSPETAFLTIQQAIDSCTASKGDTIWVMPGHAENVTSVTALALDTAGISVIGLGVGPQIPTVSLTAAAGSLVVSAANCYVGNIKVVSNFTDGVTAGVTISGNGCTLDGLVMRETASTKEFLIGISVAAGVTDLTINKLDLQGVAGGSMTNGILFAGATTNTTILDSFVHCDSSDDLVDHLTAASINLRVNNCVLLNMDTGAAGYCIRGKSDGTGVVTNCRFGYNKVDAEISLGAAMWWIGNIGTNTITDGGVTEPAGAAAIP